MNRTIGIILLVLGVILVVFGVSASDSFSSDVSRFFTGSPTNKAIWLLAGGAVSVVAGFVLLFQRSKGV